MAKTTVIIRVKNEADWIGHAIQSVIDKIENSKIIIVDNSSEDNSINIAKLFKHDTSIPDSKRYVDLDIINIENYSPGKAINQAVNLVSSPTVLLLSSHCVLTEYSENLVEELLKENVAVFGKQIPRYFGKRIVPRYIWSHYTEERTKNMFSKLENRYFLHNGAAFYEKKILKKFPFNEKVSGKEDRFWANKIVESKMSYLYSPKFVIKHHYTVKGNSWKYISTRY